MAQKLDEPDVRRGRSRWLGLTQVAVLLVLIAIALYFARAPDRIQRDVDSDPAFEDGNPAVSVIQPVPTAQALTVELTGSVRLDARTTVRSEVAGRVTWVSPKFNNGGSIAAHETFITVDPAEFELRVQMAETAVKAAEARLAIERARGDADARKFSVGRPGAQVPDLVRRLPWIAIAEAELTKARAALKLAMLQLERTEISLPYDVRVVASDVAAGELVGPAELVGDQSSLGVVYRTDALQVNAPIEPKDLAYLDPVIGRTARVQATSGTYDAEVVRVSSVVAPKTRLASLFLKFAEDPPPDSLPLPGTFAEVVITGPSYDDVYVLPETVLQGRDSVWVVDEGVLTSFEPWTLGRTAAGWVVEVFDAGEGVVVGTLPGAREGLEVTVIDATPSE